ncbi:MAG: FemAB family XrtA/PEP-CTERM system-associated protein [Sphingorhabdus sp.]|uniref:FemAB family XrtA/PEP-CTERM system-associated protein n=1 Tax=Sphingorhabdus sp. TaxID=1902408 RepID=UPI0038FCF875
MNAPMLRTRLRLRLADLADANEVARLDAWVMDQENGLPFHRPKWLLAIEAGTGQVAHCLVAERGGSIVGLLPFHVVHSALFGRALVSSAFAVGGGILSTTTATTRRLAQEICDLAESWSCPTVELRGGSMPGKGWIEKRDSHANFLKPLHADNEAELLAIPRKQRAEVRKGLENDLTVETGRDTANLDRHYAIFAESVHNLGTPVFPKALMASVLHAFGEDADILTVLHQGLPVASVFSLYHKGVVMPYWGGGVWDARRLRANDVMYYALMNHARQQGCTHFDFGRSKTESGAYFFKKNWGFEPEPMAYAIHTADGQEPRDINPNSPKYKAKIGLWQKLPLSVANRLGPWIGKGLG